jgi:UPF0755 protein
MSGDWSDATGERVDHRGQHEPAFYDHEQAGDHFDDGYGPADYEGQHADERHHEYEEYEEDEPDWPVVPGLAPTGHRTRGDNRGGTRGGGSGGSGNRGSGGSGGSGHPVLKVLAALVVVLLVILGAGWFWAQRQIEPGGHPGAAVTVDIPKGSSASQIGHRLASAGIIHEASLFALYVHLHGYKLLPGTYSLHKNSSYSSAISALEAGPRIVTAKLVVPEGFTVAQIAAAVGKVPHMGLSAQKFLAAAQSGTVRSPFEPAGINNLEGLLFPATYTITQGETEVDLLESMIGTFDDQAQSLGLTAAATRLGMTPYQVVMVASIIEREAKMPADRANVASVIYNRLKKGMKLGADSTQAYYLRLSNPGVDPTAVQDDQPSPYNTRVHAGLPPTPIANPGLASLQAASNPPTTSYLFWVEIKPDGQLGFASDNSGFIKLQHECQAAGLC